MANKLKTLFFFALRSFCSTTRYPLIIMLIITTDLRRLWDEVGLSNVTANPETRTRVFVRYNRRGGLS